MPFENATPRPWATNSHHVPARVESEAEHGIVNDGWIICDCAGPHAEANAELIVTAVNAHANLMNAAQAAVYALKSYEYGNSSPDLAQGVVVALEAALKLGEGGDQ